MYTEAAAAGRRCTAQTRDAQPCRGWACWGDPHQRCNVHGGIRRHRPERCTCAAYAWPHRPGGGLCRWPEPPVRTCATAPGTRRRRWRRRVRDGRVTFERR